MWQKLPTVLPQFKRDHGSYHLLRPNRPLVYSLFSKLNYYHKVLMFGFHVKQFSVHWTRSCNWKCVSKCHCDRVVFSKALDKSANFQSVTACVDLANYWITVTWVLVKSFVVAALCSRSQKIMDHLAESLKNFSAKLQLSAVWQATNITCRYTSTAIFKP